MEAHAPQRRGQLQLHQVVVAQLVDLEDAGREQGNVVEHRFHGDRFRRARDVAGVHRCAVACEMGAKRVLPQPSANVSALVPV